MTGKLSIVSTPIGNLEDISERALRTLREADILGCEDTRVTSKLLTRYGIKTTLFTLHQHSSDSRLKELLGQALTGSHIAYVSDAGTPGVNDPGGRLVELAYEMGVTMDVIPGPSALTSAIAMCGFPMEKFTYIGFIPQKKRRMQAFQAAADREEATVFFESTHRILKTLEDLNPLLGERTVYLGRELTKIHETHLRGTVGAILTALAGKSIKGEFVCVISPKP